MSVIKRDNTRQVDELYIIEKLDAHSVQMAEMRVTNEVLAHSIKEMSKAVKDLANTTAKIDVALEKIGSAEEAANLAHRRIDSFETKLSGKIGLSEYKDVTDKLEGMEKSLTVFVLIGKYPKTAAFIGAAFLALTLGWNMTDILAIVGKAW